MKRNKRRREHAKLEKVKGKRVEKIKGERVEK
jgi:hypothetical protein